MMASYAAAGIVLMLIGKKWWEYRRRRRVVTGTASMFNRAQTDNRELLMKERDETLATHGLSATKTGTISAIESRDDEDSSADGFFGSGRSLEGDELLDRARPEAGERKPANGAGRE